MALLFIDGFDANDIATKWIASGFTTGTAITRFGTGRSVITSGSDSMAKVITASAQVTVGFALYASSGQLGMNLKTDSGATTHISVLRNTWGFLEVRRGTSTGTLLATGTTILPINTWNYIEVQATVADAGGIVRVRINGSSSNEINFSGDTKNAGTSTNIDQVNLTCIEVGASGRFDDVYILNSTGSANTTFLGDIRIHTLSPDGNGTNSQLTGSDGNQTDNYQLVDELPASTSDYVGSATVGQRDTYSLANLPTVSQVFGVQNNFLGAKSDATAASAKSALLISSTLYYGATRTLGTSYVSYGDVYDTNPNTATTWTASDVNAMEAGMEVA